MKLQVKFVCPKKDNPTCAWEIKCKDCPLIPAFDATSQPHRSCSAGIITNLQGPVPLKTCEHYVHESITMDGKKLYIECKVAGKPENN